MKNLRMQNHCCLSLIVLMFILNSCIGVSADIQMRKDGSGKIILEYRLSRMAENIGRLDGNERWQIIPIGRADWERTAARIAGIKLASFSSREEAKDIVNKVTLEFKNTEALLKFLDPFGRRVSLDRVNGSNKLHITLNGPLSPETNADLLELMKQVSAGYSFRVGFTAGGNSTMTITDGAGRAITPPQGAEVISQGKKVSLAIDTGEILTRTDGLGMDIIWE